MFKFIMGGLLWAVLFFSVFPVIMVGMLSVMTNNPGHHPEGRPGFLRDYYLISLPLMPGAAAVMAVGVGSSMDVATWLDWCVAAVFAAGGGALYLTRPIRAAFGRLRATAKAAAAAAREKAQ